MAASDEGLEELLGAAEQLAEGPAKVAALQEAVRMADHLRDVELGFNTRLKLMEAALTSGFAEVLMVAYAWCLATAEREPERFRLQQILFRYRWAVIYLPTYPTIKRSRIEEAIADMTKRYQRAGYSLRSVHLLRWKVAMKLGDLKMASEARRAWSRSRVDCMSDDDWTELVTEIDYRLMREQWTKAVQAAAGYIDGSLKQPGYLDSVLSWMPTVLLRLGRDEEAMAVHQRGYRLTIKNAALVTQAARHIEFLSLTGNFPRASRLIERYLPYCVKSDPEDQSELYPAIVLYSRMLLQLGQETVRLRLTEDVPGFKPTGKYRAAELQQQYWALSVAISDAYDARNGNDYCRHVLGDMDNLINLARPIPINTRH